MNVIKFLLMASVFYLSVGLVDLLILGYLFYKMSFQLFLIYIAVSYVLVRVVKIRTNEKAQTFWFSFFNEWIPRNEMVIHPEAKKTLDDKDTLSICCYHPHGVFCFSAWIHGILNPYFRKLKMKAFTHNLVVTIPIVSLFSRTMGCENADAHNMKRIMAAKKSPMLLVPGGGDEMVYSQPKIHDLFINRRTGFISYCMRFGYCAIPVFCFGETELYQCPIPLPKSDGLRYYSMVAFLLLHYFFIRGWMWITALPKRKPMYTFFGPPVIFPECEGKPNKEQVEKWHKIYIEKLVELRERSIEMINNDPKRFRGVETGKLKMR